MQRKAALCQLKQSKKKLVNKYECLQKTVNSFLVNFLEENHEGVLSIQGVAETELMILKRWNSFILLQQKSPNPLF